jgi:ATPase subunit of ABC transporter with duplicated ATPase domains
LEVLMTNVNRLPVLVSLQHLCFQFANGETLLDDLNLSIDRTPTGIVGRNGRGKSILAQLIAGVLSPSRGSLGCSASVAYVSQNVVIAAVDTVAHVTGAAEALAALERMALGAAQVDDLALIDERWDLADRLRRALDAAGLEQLGVETPAAQLSGGQLARVALIGALLAAPQLLVLDEPTNHLDSAGRTWLLRVLADWRGGLVVVSHDRQLLERRCTVVTTRPIASSATGSSKPPSPRWSTHAWSAAVSVGVCKKTMTACNAMPPIHANRQRRPMWIGLPGPVGKAPPPRS